MDALPLTITKAGLAAIVDAQSSALGRIVISQIGLTNHVFTAAPTLEILPGEFKRLASISGEAASDAVLHMMARDASADTYDYRGFALYLGDGTLFAVYGQAAPIAGKASVSVTYIVLDLLLSAGQASVIEFGDTNWLNPPATTERQGVAELATLAEAAAGADDQRIITPFTLAQRLAALANTLNKAIAALGARTDADIEAFADDFAGMLATLASRTITGDGLVSGGGNLTANRVLSVLAATGSDVAAGTAADRAVTPAALSALARTLTQNGYAVLPGTGNLIMQWGRFSAIANGTSSVLFPIAFPNACFSAVPAGGVSGGPDSKDNPPVLLEPSISATGFSVYSADDSSAGQSYIAIGN